METHNFYKSTNIYLLFRSFVSVINAVLSFVINVVRRTFVILKLTTNICRQVMPDVIKGFQPLCSVRAEVKQYELHALELMLFLMESI